MAAREELQKAIVAACDKAQAQEPKLEANAAMAAVMMAAFSFLVRRIEELEALPMEYAGTYWPDKEYRERQFVTFGGRVWACVAKTTRNKPGLSEDWKLAVDRGRDGKDAR